MLPRSRMADELVRDWLHDHQPQWEWFEKSRAADCQPPDLHQSRGTLAVRRRLSRGLGAQIGQRPA
jgi:hypothetical protein